MSWLIAEMRPSLSPSDIDALETLHPSLPRHRIRSEGFYIAACGLEETCLRGRSIIDGEMFEWIVLGMGFRQQGANVELCNANDWKTLLAAREPLLHELDGHFAIVRWSSSELECFNDQLGMRTLHIARNDERCIISTRLDWIAARTGTSSINMSSFGAHWLLTNQMTSDGLLNDVKRLGPGGRFRL